MRSRNRDTDVGNKYMDTKRGRGRAVSWKIGTDIFTDMYKIENECESTVEHKELSSVLCGHLNGKEI